MKSEQTTRYFRKSINILFVSNPRGTSLGILGGVVLDGLIALFTPYLKGVEAINIAAIKIWHLVGLGIFTANLPEYLNRKEIDPSISNAIKYIEKQKTEGKITDWQAKQMYIQLNQTVLESVTLDEEIRKQSDKMQKNAAQPNSGE